VAAALFSGGALTGRALADDPSAPPAAHAQVIPGIATDGNQGMLVAPANGGRDAATSGGGGAPNTSAAMPVYPCQGDISGAVTGSTIDPSKTGLTARFLTNGFKLQNLSLSADGGCAKDGMPADPHPVLNTAWVQDGSSSYVNVTQRIAAEPTANVLTPGMAQFWSGGYAFMVNASPAVMPAGRPTAVPGAAIDSIGGGSSSSPVAPDIAPNGPFTGGADGTATLQAVIAQLAPDVSLQCFYRQADGSWADLAALGIGDPRPAIPAGYAESSINVRTFTPPGADCATPVAPNDMAGFDATFLQSSADGSFGGGIFINAGGAGGRDLQAGHLDGYGAYWSNGTYAFNIGAKSNEPLGRDAIRAIALALDPKFDSACLAVTSTVTDADVAAAGFHAPSLPSGYSLDSVQLQRTELSPGCAGNASDARTGYSLQWNMRAGSSVISASANRVTGQGVQPGGISSRGLSWSAADGTQYGVYGYTEGKDGVIAKDVLIAVAKSMDPSLDPASLPEQPGAGETTPASPPKVLPATR
jgi:hypothetical protein